MSAVIGLVGAAHIHTPGFVQKLAARQDTQVRWVWDAEQERASQSAANLGAEIAVVPEQIWSDPEVNGAVITSQTQLHEELVLPACAAGKHLFVEKPLGMAAADAERMATAIEAAGILFQTGYFMRGLPHFQFLKEAIRAGHFGQLTRIRLSNCHAGSLADYFTPKWLWMTDPAQAGVGAFGDLGTHILDILLWMIDGPIDRVTASVETAIEKYGANCDEYGEGLIRFEGGLLAVLAAGWVDVDDPVKAVISGTEGHAHVIGDALYFQSEHVPGAHTQSAWTQLPALQPHPLDLFLDAVAGPNPEAAQARLITARQAADRNQIMDALYLGAREQRWVVV